MPTPRDAFSFEQATSRDCNRSYTHRSIEGYILQSVAPLRGYRVDCNRRCARGGGAGTAQQWLLFAYRLPWEPSAKRVLVSVTCGAPSGEIDKGPARQVVGYRQGPGVHAPPVRAAQDPVIVG